MCLKFSIIKNFSGPCRSFFNEVLQGSQETSQWPCSMGTVAGLSLFTYWLTKAINSFAAGSSSNPMRQKHPTPGLSSEGTMHLTMSIIDVWSWKGPWHHELCLFTKKRLVWKNWCINPLNTTLLQRLETWFSSCRIQKQPTSLLIAALMRPVLWVDGDSLELARSPISPQNSPISLMDA